MNQGKTKKDIERLLNNTLIPVEPDQEFLHKLQARLVTYRGRRAVNGWMIFAVVATAALLAISAVGLAMRIVMALAGLVGFFMNRRQSSSRPKALTS